MKQIILNEIKKIINERIKWTKELVQDEAIKYNTRVEFQKKSANAYEAARRNGWLDDVTGHMIKLKRDWTFDDIKKIAKKYDKLIDFKTKENAAYLFARRHHFLGDVITHMKRNVRWNKDTLHKEALKYKTRSEFEQNSPNAYNSALRFKIMDDITTHMKPQGHRYKRIIYVFEFPDNHFYVGLTFNEKRRNLSHMSDVKSSVYKHIIQTGLKPKFKIITDYVDIETAQKKENEILRQYINNGWIPLNRTKTGGLGSSNKKWTKEMVMDIIKNYTKLNDFRKNEPNAWSAANKSDWYDEVTSHLEKIIKVKKYTREILEKIIKNYETLADFSRNEPTAYAAVLVNKWYDLIENLKRKEHPWTNFDNVKKEAEKYNMKTDFSKNSPGAFASAVKNGWIDDVTKHMTPKFLWTKNLVNDIAKKYDNSTEFRAHNKRAYDAAQKYGWLDDVTKHMKKRKVWDDESVKQEALKYQNREAFRMGSNGAYSYAKKNNILDDVTSHMELKNVKGHKEDIFTCEFCGKKIGGFSNLRRHVKVSHNVEL
jgi:predicted GIY-YIG superfamily endonuclease